MKNFSKNNYFKNNNDKNSRRSESKIITNLMIFEKKDLIQVEVLPKKLDEEVASLMVQGFGGVVTQLTEEQADYINVPQDGPFKEDSYKY